MTLLSERRLGATSLAVPPLCVGCAALGDMPETFDYRVPEARALETLRAAFTGPIRFVDTAASYGNGESERRIGMVLRELGGVPPAFVLSTKADRHLCTGDFSGDQFKRSVERSLRLLGLDRLQLVYMHDPEHTTFESSMAAGGPVDVLQQFKREGIIEHVGVAGGPIEMLIRYVETGAFEAVITHNRYTLLNQSAAPLIDIASRRGLGVLNAAPYGSGLLAKGPEAYPRYAYTNAPLDLLTRARALDEICRDFDVPLAAVALQFSLREPRIHSTIVGMTRPERIQETLDLAAMRIPEGLWHHLTPHVGPPDDPEAARWHHD
jgi:D-threo-aldose 1-dehydrogenase